MLVAVAVVIALVAGIAGTLVALRLVAGSSLGAARRQRNLLLAEAKRLLALPSDATAKALCSNPHIRQ